MGKFLGVGDPIYNEADPRWAAQHGTPGFLTLFRTIASVSADSPKQFGRLVGSAEELKASASNWTGQAPILLEGAAAVKSGFFDQLNQLDHAPSVVHLATHVVSSGTQSSIALGLGPNAESEFLTTADVASLRVPGAIVTMSGCDTGGGEVRAGAGLLGLTRAWQMAGASAVVATSWPVLDSSGDIFSSFYKHLGSVPAAEALRLSQLDMLHSGTWRATPSYWAAYQITGGTR
jgi:CHAT domain-containing protein